MNSTSMDCVGPVTTSLVLGLLEANIINVRGLLVSLVEDHEGSLYPSRKLCSAGVGGERVGCLYEELFGGKIDLQQLGSLRRTTAFKSWCNSNNITFTGSKKCLIIEAPVSNFSPTAVKKRPYSITDEKQNYNQDYVKKQYQETELPNIFLLIEDVWKRDWNRTSNKSNDDLMRQKIFQVFILRIIDLTGVTIDSKYRKKSNDINAEIVNSLRSFYSYAATSDSGKMKTRLSYEDQLGCNIIIRAATHETTLNKTEIIDALGLPPKSSFLNKLFPPKKRSISSDSATSDTDATEINLRFEAGSGSEPVGHEDQILDDINNDFDQVDNSEYDEESSQDSISIASNIVEFDDFGSDTNFAGCRHAVFAVCRPSRLQYKNSRDLKPAVEFWHNMCIINTNTFQTYCVLDDSDPKNPFYNVHRELLQSVATRELYQQFVVSQIYLDHLGRNPGSTIGFTLFKEAKCKCIKWDHLRKCADTVTTQMAEYWASYRRFRNRLSDETVQACAAAGCQKCCDPELLECFRSEYYGNFVSYILCPAERHVNIPRTSVNLFTQEKKASIESRQVFIKTETVKEMMNNANIQSLTSSQSRKIRKVDKGSRPSKTSNAAPQKEVLTIQRKQCFNSNCPGESCGVDKRLSSKICPLESSPDSFVTVRIYIKQEYEDADGNKISKNQKELREFFKPVIVLINEMEVFLKSQFLPHHYLVKWNRHHINLLFDSIHINTMELSSPDEAIRCQCLLETLYFQKDFANMFKCVGQDGATCEQPRTAIQEASNTLTLYIRTICKHTKICAKRIL